MVVDDHQDNLDLLSEHLEDIEEYDVEQAENGEQALACVEARLPDLILLDVMMPGINGIEVCRRVKRMAGDEYIPIVLITAYSDAENKRSGLEAGADDFIAKPFDRYELMARIRNLLHTKELWDERKQTLERIEREVKEIGNLQRSLIPGLNPDIEGVQFFDFYMPSREAGGDFFDYVVIDEHTIGISIGDVSGHGPPASVLMAMVKMITQLSSSKWNEPALLLKEIDYQLGRFILPGDFITMFYGVIDIKKEKLRFSSAGHCAPVLFGPKHPEPFMLKVENGYPLCLIDEEENQFEEREVDLPIGSRILLLTDGIIEVQNSERRIWGIGNLMELLEAHPETSGNEVIGKILEEITEFNAADQFRDDCTLLLLDYNGQTD